MTEKLTIQETKELLKFAIDLSFAGVFAAEDGKLDFKDLRHFIELIDDILPAFKGLSAVPAELEDLSALEMDELVTVVLTELDSTMVREEALFVVKKCLTALKACYEAFLAIRGMHLDS